MVKTISRISITGIWLGITAFIVVISVMNGFNHSIQSRLLEVEPHVVVDFNHIKSTKAIFEDPVYKKLEKMDVELVGPIAYQDVILRTSEGFVQRAVANGVTRERLKNLLEYANKRSASKTPEEIVDLVEGLNPGEVILGVGLADSIGLFRDDSVVLIPPETLLLPASEIPQLSQAMVKGYLLTDVERIDGGSFYYIIDESFPRLRQSAGRRMGLQVWLSDPTRASEVKAALQDENTQVETWEERNASLFFALKMEKILVSFLVGLSTLIAGLSIISVMVLLITQKRKDIGNLLAMGMTRGQTRRTFVRIGMFLAMSGVVAGIICGILLSYAVNEFSQDVLPAYYEDTSIPAEVRLTQVLTVFLIAITFSFVALSMTMRRLSSFRPSEILRG